MDLKNIVKENLLDVKYEKKQFDKSMNNLKKLNNFLNNHILETQQEKEKFAMRVFNELVLLESNGHYENLISEAEWKGFPTWVWDTIKEKVVRGIVNFVAPSKKDTWAANVIVTGLGDIDLNEIPKLGNCEFVSKQLAKAIVEGSFEYVKREKFGFTGGISDVIRNALVETLEQNDLIKNMEDKLLSHICPAIRKVGNQFSKIGVSSN